MTLRGGGAVTEGATITKMVGELRGGRGMTARATVAKLMGPRPPAWPGPYVGNWGLAGASCMSACLRWRVRARHVLMLSHGMSKALDKAANPTDLI